MTTRFGQFVDFYNTGRQAYDDNVIVKCMQHIPAMPDAYLLDVGCGTGISTRQMSSKYRRIIGCDPDLDMLARALSLGGRNISYALRSAEDLQFPENMFNAVTAFGSFHWFCNQDAMSEIKRVLVDNGVFIVVNKWDTGPFYDDMLSIITQHLTVPIERKKSICDPAEMMSEAGLCSTAEEVIESTEIFRLESLKSQIASMNPWHQLLEERRPLAMEELVNYFTTQLKDNVYTRPLITKITSGYK